LSAEVSFGALPHKIREDGAMATSERTFTDTGDRLRKARIAVAIVRQQQEWLTMKVFAEDTGTNDDNLGNWERGISEVPTSYVSGLRRRFGIDHNYIYDNDPSNLPHAIAREIAKQDK
jgi:DNA-binding transcriptional regulator YiaG